MLLQSHIYCSGHSINKCDHQVLYVQMIFLTCSHNVLMVHVKHNRTIILIGSGGFNRGPVIAIWMMMSLTFVSPQYASKMLAWDLMPYMLAWLPKAIFFRWEKEQQSISDHIKISIFPKRERVRRSMQRVDRGGAAHRAMNSHRLQRRIYSVPGPNALWHLDGYHKLIRCLFQWKPMQTYILIFMYMYYYTTDGESSFMVASTAILV